MAKRKTIKKKRSGGAGRPIKKDKDTDKYPYLIQLRTDASGRKKFLQEKTLRGMTMSDLFNEMIDNL